MLRAQNISHPHHPLPSSPCHCYTDSIIYPDGENFGGIIDSDIIAIATNPRGIGQYDRAVVYAYDNAVIQFCPDLQGTAACRLQELAIAALYIEWILLEEAAIFIADKDIAELLSVERITDPVAFLKRVDAINDNYSRTIEFWNIKVNYPTSQKSIEALRSAFKTDESLKNMKRNQEQLSTVFDIKCDIIDRKEARRMDKSLAVLSMLAIFSAWIDSYDYTATWASVLPASAIALIQRLLFGLILLVAGFSIFRMTAGHLLFRSKKDRKKERKGFFKKRP